MLLHGLAVLLLVSAGSLVWVKFISSAVKILAFQSFVLGLIALVLGKQTGLRDLYVVAGLTVLFKTVFIPGILHRTLRRTQFHAQTVRWGGREFSLLSTAALVAVAYYLTRSVNVYVGVMGHLYLPIAVSLLLIGLFVMVTQHKALMQGIGLVVMENGLFLLALASTYGVPFVVDVGIFVDVLIAVLLISLLTYRMQGTFQSTNTEKLRRLRG